MATVKMPKTSKKKEKQHPPVSRQSCGVIVFREEAGKRLYLILHYEAGHWDFPKGGVEAGETPEMTLRRELGEETGITDLELMDGFRESIDYSFFEDGARIHKTVTFFLGKTIQKKVRLSFEHTDFGWHPFAEGLDKLTYGNAKNLLQQADSFLDDFD